MGHMMSDFLDGYNLGYEHGKQIGRLDKEIEDLEEDIFGTEKQYEKAEFIKDSLKEDGITV